MEENLSEEIHKVISLDYIEIASIIREILIRNTVVTVLAIDRKKWTLKVLSVSKRFPKPNVWETLCLADGRDQEGGRHVVNTLDALPKLWNSQWNYSSTQGQV